MNGVIVQQQAVSSINRHRRTVQPIPRETIGSDLRNNAARMIVLCRAMALSHNIPQPNINYDPGFTGQMIYMDVINRGMTFLETLP